MRAAQIILFVLLSALMAGCDTPTEGFERTNINDPRSPEFGGGTVTGLNVSADSSGTITLRWGESNRIVTKNVLEKSLGDSLNFTPIAELEPEELSYVDTNLEVRKETYYRLSSFIELDGEKDVLFGRSQTQLLFGEIVNEEFEFLTESNRMKLSWSTDVPFYTHFIISSENVLTEQQENSVKIPAGTIENSFEDPLMDIDFKTREYTITGIIEYKGGQEIVTEKQVTFDAASFFRPIDFEINILNEQDWEIAWENVPFFATGVELIRRTNHEDVVFNLPSETLKYVDSLLLDAAQDSRINQFRRYQLRFVTENNESESIEKFDDIDIFQPLSNIPITVQGEDPDNLTLQWYVSGNDRELIKEFIIEKPHPVIPDRFQEYARVDGSGPYQFTDTHISESGNPTYRIRTVTSRPSQPVSFAFSHDYELDHSFNIGMDQVSWMESTSDKRYIAAVSANIPLFASDNFILIYDLELGQNVASIQIPSQRISDFKINPDESSIYFNIPSERSIYKADFPGGENIQKIIGNTGLSNAQVDHIDISPDESFLVGTGGRGFVKRWDLKSYENDFLFAEFETPTSYRDRNIVISPDGTKIAGNNGLPFIMDAENGSVLNILPWTSPNVIDLQFSRDGDYFAFVSGSSTLIYSTESWEEIVRTNVGRRAAFHPEKPILALKNRSGAYTYDLGSKKILDKISSRTGSGPTLNTANKILFIDDERIAIVTNQASIQIWKAGAQKRWKEIN